MRGDVLQCLAAFPASHIVGDDYDYPDVKRAVDEISLAAYRQLHVEARKCWTFSPVLGTHRGAFLETGLTRAHPPEIYAPWDAAAQEAALNLSGSWKTNKSVTSMLEHVDCGLGEGHLRALRGLFGLPDAEIQRLCSANDARGGAQLRDIGGLRVTGASLRYLHHAMLMLSASASWERIVEVGGGYGGLACIVAAVAAKFGRSISCYRMYDLPGPAQLQRAYLSGTGLRVEWGDPTSLGADMGESRADLLVSCYAVSELDEARREGYLRELLPRCSKVFLAWNTASHSAQLPQGQFAVVPEEPCSAIGNVFITRK